MGKGSFVGLILVGSMLLYLGIFWLTAFGVPFALAGSAVKQDMDTKAWSGTYTQETGIWYIPAINLRTSDQRYEGKAYSSIGTLVVIDPDKFTVEIRAKLVTAIGVKDHMLMDIDSKNKINQYRIQVTKTQLFISPDWGAFWSGTAIGISLQTNLDQWYIWTLVCDTGALTVYRDLAQVGSGSSQANEDVGACYMSVRAFSETPSGAAARFDYYYVDSGLHPPGGGGDAGTVVIEAKQDMDGDTVWTALSGLSVAVQKDGVTYGGPYTTNAEGKVTITNAPLASYTASGTYSGKSDSDTASLSSNGQTITLSLYFSETTTPPNGDDWWTVMLERINAVLNRQEVKAGLSLGGIALVGIGVVGLFIPGKKQYYPPSPYQY